MRIRLELIPLGEHNKRLSSINENQIALAIRIGREALVVLLQLACFVLISPRIRQALFCNFSSLSFCSPIVSTLRPGLIVAYSKRLSKFTAELASCTADRVFYVAHHLLAFVDATNQVMWPGHDGIRHCLHLIRENHPLPMPLRCLSHCA